MAAVARVGVELDARGAISGLRGLDAQAKKTQSAFGDLRKAALQVATAATVIQGAKFVFAKTAELETQTRSLKVLTGSLQDAQKVIKELQDFGAVTPFTSSELIETAKRLKAFGFETEKIVDVTKRLGDIAGATGADLGGIATAFGQIQAKGRLQGEELLQLQERGVDLQGTLRKEYDLTAEEFQKALSKGQIGADAVNFALEKLTDTGGKYAEGAFAQSDTLSGKLSTLQDNVDNLARTLGNVLSPAIKGILDQAIGSLNALNQLLAIGARAQDFGMTQEQRVKILRQAEQEAKEIALIRGGGKLDPAVFNQIKMQREKDLIEAYGFKTGQIQPELVAPDIERIRPELGGGTAPGGKGGAVKERVDMTKELFALNQRLRQETEAGNEREAATLELMVRRQVIAESNFQSVRRENELQEALFDFRRKIFALDERIAEQKRKDQEEVSKAIQKQLKEEEELARKRLEADPGFQMKKQLEELLDVQNQVAAGATVIGNAFAGAFKAVITGSKSAEDALRDMLAATAEHFLDMAAQIIAQQLTMILYGTITKALGITGGGGNFSSAPLGAGFSTGATPSSFDAVGAGLFAEGGFVDRPTNAIIGEGGESEYIIPESKMRESMARYSRGSRGPAVIPESGASGASGEGGGTAIATPIDVRYTVERINSVDYVTADQFQAGMQQAATQGAKQGEQQTLKRLQMSGSTRKRIGL